MEETFQKQILYAKVLFEEGCKILDQGMFLAEGRAVLHFQDAVEILLRVISSKVDAKLDKKTFFPTLLNNGLKKKWRKTKPSAPGIMLNKSIANS